MRGGALFLQSVITLGPIAKEKRDVPLRWTPR